MVLEEGSKILERMVNFKNGNININPNKNFLYKITMMIVSNFKCFLKKNRANILDYTSIPDRGLLGVSVPRSLCVWLRRHIVFILRNINGNLSETNTK